jgi:hypothetical protein
MLRVALIGALLAHVAAAYALWRRARNARTVKYVLKKNRHSTYLIGAYQALERQVAAGTVKTSATRCLSCSLNERLNGEGEQPVAFDSDCREGICGMCGLMVNGEAHGPKSPPPANCTCDRSMPHRLRCLRHCLSQRVRVAVRRCEDHPPR